MQAEAAKRGHGTATSKAGSCRPDHTLAPHVPVSLHMTPESARPQQKSAVNQLSRLWTVNSLLDADDTRSRKWQRSSAMTANDSHGPTLK